MSITINLPPQAEEKLRRRAAESGVGPDALARQLLEQALNGDNVPADGHPLATLNEVLVPFRKEVQDSGMTDDELKEFFTEVRDEVRSDKQARRTQG